MLAKMISWNEETSELPLDILRKEFDAELKTVSQRSPEVGVLEWLRHNSYYVDGDLFLEDYSSVDYDSVEEGDIEEKLDSEEDGIYSVEGHMEGKDDAKVDHF